VLLRDDPSPEDEAMRPTLKTLPLFLLLLAAGHAVPAAAAPETTVIPVVVNIYSGSGATAARVKEVVAAANKIFADNSAGIKLAVVATNTLNAAQSKAAGDDGTPGTDTGVASDGKFTEGERPKIYEYGKGEVGKLPGKKGAKVSFALLPTQELILNPGITAGKHPVMLIQDQGAGTDDTTKIGSTLAHEVCHLLGLLNGHVIQGDIVADGNGHADPDVAGVTGKGNLMCPARTRRGTALTAAQIEVIQKNARKYGWCTEQFQANFPAVKLTQGFGRNTDGVVVTSGPSAPPLYDVRDVWLAFSAPVASGTAQLDVQVQMAGVPAVGESVNAVYALGFDADANPATGITYGGVPGIDRIVRTTVQGTFQGTPGAGGLMVSTTLQNTATGQVQTLPPAVLGFDQEYPQDFPSSTPEPVEMPIVSTTLSLSLDPSLLGLQAPLVPVVATAGDGVSTWQTNPFGYDQQASSHRPTVSTFGNGVPNPGQPYPVAVTGLAPGSSFELDLDDTAVLTGTVNSQGSFSGSFVFPATVPNSQPHFLTALDALGDLATGMTCPVWGPP
jgi:hypothetical protein